MATATNKIIDFVVTTTRNGYYSPKGAFIACRYGKVIVTTTYYKDGSVDIAEVVK